jgi:uroporphyrinogen decarboxylase
MHQRVRGMENAMLDPFMFPVNSDKLVGKLADLKIEFWDSLLDEIGDVVDIVGEGDDYGTQQSQLISRSVSRVLQATFCEGVEFYQRKSAQRKTAFSFVWQCASGYSRFY